MADSVQHSAGSGKDKARTNQEQRTTLSSSPGTPPHTRDGTAHCNFIRKILNSRSFTLLTGIATLYALFGNDIKLLLVHKSADAVFTVLSSICFFLFLIELIVASLVNSKCVWKNRRQDGSDCKQRWLGISGYFLGLFFMLDLVALLALVPEIPWIWEPIVGKALLSPSYPDPLCSEPMLHPPSMTRCCYCYCYCYPPMCLAACRRKHGDQPQHCPSWTGNARGFPGRSHPPNGSPC